MKQYNICYIPKLEVKIEFEIDIINRNVETDLQKILNL